MSLAISLSFFASNINTFNARLSPIQEHTKIYKNMYLWSIYFFVTLPETYDELHEIVFREYLINLHNKS